MREKYNKEVGNIEQNCTYTSEAHHIIALHNKKMGILFQLVPPIVAAILAGMVGVGFTPIWWSWFSVVSAVIAAVGNILNPMKEYYDNLNTAKNFSILKHDARVLRETFSSKMSDEEYSIATQILHDRYNDLVRFAPPTDKKSFDEARRRIKEGVHEFD